MKMATSNPDILGMTRSLLGEVSMNRCCSDLGEAHSKYGKKYIVQVTFSSTSVIRFLTISIPRHSESIYQILSIS